MTTGLPVRRAVFVAGFALLTLSGCGGMSRRFVVESNVPTAQVYINDKPIGPAPAHAAFEYYGYYKVTLVHPDCQPETHRVHVVAPWYAYPPFDFLVSLWPFPTEDVRRYYFELKPARRTDTGQLISEADALRQRGMALPVPEPVKVDPLLQKIKPPGPGQVPSALPASPDALPPAAAPGTVPDVGPPPGASQYIPSLAPPRALPGS